MTSHSNIQKNVCIYKCIKLKVYTLVFYNLTNMNLLELLYFNFLNKVLSSKIIV